MLDGEYLPLIKIILLSLLIPLILFSVSCSKVQYIFEQGVGQVSLFVNARENSEVLEDPFIPEKMKEIARKKLIELQLDPII